MQQQLQFTHDELTYAIFDQQGPQFTCKPFTLFRYPLNSFSFTYDLGNVDIDKMDIRDLAKHVAKIGSRINTSPKELLEIPPYLYAAVLSSFRDAVTSWYEYIIREMPKYCESAISQLNWQVFKSCPSLLTSLNLEQKVWVAINTQKDKEFWLDTIADVRNGLLPWLDNKMYWQLEKKRANTRYNSEYENQRRDMIEGKLTDVSIENPKETTKLNTEENSFSQTTDDDLDIIS